MSSGSVSPPSCVNAAAVSSRNSAPRLTSKRAIRIGLPTSSQINAAISSPAPLIALAAAFSHAMRWCVGCLRLAAKAMDAAATARSTPDAPDSAMVPIGLPVCGATRFNPGLDGSVAAGLPSTKSVKWARRELAMSTRISQSLDLHVGQERHQRMHSHLDDRRHFEFQQCGALLARKVE